MQMVVHMRPFIGASLRWVLGRGDVDMKSNLPLSNLRSFFALCPIMCRSADKDWILCPCPNNHHRLVPIYPPIHLPLVIPRYR